MSRFYFSWEGGKRLELQHVDEVIDWAAFDTVVEPFAGSAALSLEIFARGLNKKTVLNDTDPNLIGMYRFIKESGSEPLYKYAAENLNAEAFHRHHKNKQPPTTFEYFYTRAVRADFQRTNTTPTRWPTLARGPKILLTDACIQSPDTTITLGDWRKCVDAHKDNPRALIFLDPPYFSSFNQSYYSHSGPNADQTGLIIDHTRMFIEILQHLETAAATIVAITNDCALIRYIFTPFIRQPPSIRSSNV